jgi:hypothetical protein
MSEWISGQELSDNFGLKEIEVLGHITKGLQPFDKIGKPIPCPKFHHKGPLLKHEIDNIDTDLYVLSDPTSSHRKESLLSDGSNPLQVRQKLDNKKERLENELADIDKEDPSHISWKYFQKPKSDNSMIKIVNNISNYLFKRSDIQKIIDSHDKKASTIPPKNDHIESKQADSNFRSDTKIISFFKSGDFWLIGEKGKEIPFKDSKGFEYIHFLIRNRNKSFHSLEVYHLGNVPSAIQGQITESSLQANKLFDDVYENAKGKLEETLESETNPEALLKIKEDIELLKEYQNQGKYSFTKDSDKCRQNIYKSIKKTTEVINNEFKAQGHSEIRKLFNVGKAEVIKSGIKFCYREELVSYTVEWQLDPE